MFWGEEIDFCYEISDVRARKTGMGIRGVVCPKGH